MPLTRAIIRPSARIWEHKLFLACREVVPSGFNSPEGKLTPGSLEFDAKRSNRDSYLTVDVFIEVEAFPYEDRENLDERAALIQIALGDIFPGITFAVWPKLVKAGWASDSIDPEFDGDMSMVAAIERARAAIAL